MVDDDRLVLATLTHGLTQAGYEVIDADNGDEAILLARQQRPDLALLDIRMEGKSGFDVAAYLRDACRIPFMFLSAFADDATVAQVRALGAVDYLVKPVDIGRIVPAVDAALAALRAGVVVPPAPAAEDPVAAAALGQPVAIAIGLLMHRHTLTRRDALARLQRLAAADGRNLAAQAQRVIEAVESLALPEPPP